METISKIDVLGIKDCVKFVKNNLKYCFKVS